MKKNIFYSLSFGLLFCACSQENVIETERTNEFTECTKVNVQIATNSWNGATTRASNDDLLKNVTLLLVESDGAEVVKRKSVTDLDFCLDIPKGEYDIFAVCGLPSEDVPNDLFETITIPEAEQENGLTDFAVGSVSVTNDYDKALPSSVSITAKRQMAWLTMKISDVPDYFSDMTLHVKGLGETYRLSDGWNTTDEGKGKFSTFSLLNKSWQKTASADVICIPCTDKNSGTEFKIEAKTKDNKTLTYAYTSTTPLIAGKHLTINLSVSDLILVKESIDVGDWDEKTEEGTLDAPTTTE